MGAGWGCEELRGIASKASSSGIDEQEFFILVINDSLYNYGRVSLSKLSGMSERRLRTIRSKAALSLQALAHVLNIAELRVSCNEKGERVVCAYMHFDDKLLELVRSRVVDFRDELIIALGSSKDIEVIGISDGGGITWPGLPEEYQHIYNELAGPAPTGGLIVVWNRYRPVASDAAVFVALSKLCRE